MTCICCKTNSACVDGHIISKFIRNRVTGIDAVVGKRVVGKRYKFRWQGEKKPTQDLQKRALMCAKCDNGVGAAIERRAASLLMPIDPSSPAQWEKMPLVSDQLLTLCGAPFRLAYYDYESCLDQDCLDAFALLTVWRALHALALDGNAPATKYLNSPKGKAKSNEIGDFLLDAHTTNEIGLPPLPTAVLYYQGPRTTMFLSAKNDEMPFAWSVLEGEEPLGVAVLFGFWVILWPFFDEQDEPEKYEVFKTKCFVDWYGQIAGWSRQ